MVLVLIRFQNELYFYYLYYNIYKVLVLIHILTDDSK